MTARYKPVAIWAASGLFILSLGTRMTGILAHELMGLVLAEFFCVHCFIHRDWFFAFNQGCFTVRRLLSCAVNAALVIEALILIVTGIRLSPDLFRFLDLHSDMQIRILHSQCAFWMLVTLSIHLGLHGSMLARSVTKHIPLGTAAAVLIIIVGILGFADRMLFEKLFLGFAFDFWDPKRPNILYFLLYGAILAAGAIGIHSAGFLLRIRHDALFKRSH